ncbi:NADPH-dependent FMN reductase [Kiloniella litopenaei]|uniref:NADPH-dependent FMN reductase n=1 Tax=Kiloniella litopenaei TaxID=1549748 RepID=A0A0M2R0F0_9PROT|nr:NAD(P)H-dependent oxidoreductase [Kiloniella litopenaei]KKJ75362.1 NADPH-dependent FMN reductase [Kiloniella litopenaei]
MKILAFAASSSRKSINKTLVTYAGEQLKELRDDVTVEVIDINDYELPLFSTDREEELGQPQLAHDFYNKIKESDGLIISFAEHNGSYTAAYKNLFDWASRIDVKVFQNKPSLFLSTSTGQGGAGSVLKSAETSAPFFGADLKAALSIPSFEDNFDRTNNQLTNVELKQKLNDALFKLAL